MMQAQAARQAQTSSRQAPAEASRSARTADHPLQHLQHSIGNRALQRSMLCSRDGGEVAQGDEVHEREADLAAVAALRRLGRRDDAVPIRSAQPAPPGIDGLGAGRPLSPPLRRDFERAFGWDFSGVRLHSGAAAARLASDAGARAFTRGRDIVFGKHAADPEAAAHRRLLAHELAHVVQQEHAEVPSGTMQTAPLVTNVVTSAAELGVGGRDITATATVGGRRTALTWTINPGGAAPAGVTVVGSGRRVRIRAAHPAVGVTTGGTPITIRAAVTGRPGDFFDAPAVMLAQVVSATYTAVPALANVPSLIPGAPPPNTGEPNRDGIAGNTVTVNVVTAPAGRPVTITFRRSLGATVAGVTITPGRRTGDIRLRISDTATGARLNETALTTVVGAPAARMADLTINAVPTGVSAIGRTGPLGPYGQLDPITFASSDSEHPLTRIVGELITLIQNDFNVAAPNLPGGFNPAFLLALAVPANNWNDQVVTGAGMLNVADGRIAIDINRFAGPGVPSLPRSWILRQRFQYSAWQGAGTVVSNTFADGRHIRSLIGTPAAPQFRTEHVFGGVHAPSPPEAYVGPPLIVLTNIVATPAPGATALAADGAATAALGVTSSVAGRSVQFTMLDGDAAITAGNPAALPATATLQGGARTGNFRVRAADTIYPNRRVDGRVRVAAVRLRRLRAAPASVPSGTFTSAVSVDAEPGARTVNWTLDAAAVAAGVTVAPATTGPGGAMNVTVTRPAGFTGTVTVTATDSVRAATTENVRIRFR